MNDDDLTALAAECPVRILKFLEANEFTNKQAGAIVLLINTLMLELTSDERDPETRFRRINTMFEHLPE